MKISTLALSGMRGWPNLEVANVAPGLNVITGPVGSGKTTVAEFLAHALFGRIPATAANTGDLPEGEAIVDGNGGRFRLRRYHDGTQTGRLTVASLDGGAVDRDTVNRLLGGISPSLLARVFAAGFASGPQVDCLAATEFAREFQKFSGNAEPARRTSELAARRDALAEELSARIAGERKASGELDQRRRAIEQQIRETERSATALELRLRGVETTLAETDSRLRYRRLELNTELRWHTTDAADWEPQLTELDQEIARWRATLADMARREAAVRSKLAQATANDVVGVTLGEQRAWMAVARQLAADLEGEVARLARASASQQCVCRDAHPRLRPMVETLARQLNRMDSLVETQQRASEAAEWTDEAEHLTRSQAELRGQLEHLLDRRQTLINSNAPTHRRKSEEQLTDPLHTFSAADAEQLEQRRLELEQERFGLVETIRREQQALKNLKSERTDVDRQRAALLTARSIEHIQRELAAVQKKLEQTASVVSTSDHKVLVDEPWRASDFLAQLSDGRLVRLELGDGGRRAWATRKNGEAVAIESLTPAERDQVYLSFVLALVSSIARHGVRLPLVLDDPFVRLDERGTAALAAVLAEFGRQGHQLLVFTSQKQAAERLAAMGAAVHDLVVLRRWKRSDDIAPLPTAGPWTPVETIDSVGEIESLTSMPPISTHTRKRVPRHARPTANGRVRRRKDRDTTPKSDGRDAA